MRYFYIICLIMSSFFTYKNCFATDEGLKYAFFLPQNVFQENTTVNNIEDMKPRYEKTSKVEEDTTKKVEQNKETLSKNSGLVNSAEKPKISLPYVRKKLVLNTDEEEIKRVKEQSRAAEAQKQNKPEPVKQVQPKPLVAPAPPQINDEIKKKLSNYVLEDPFGAEEFQAEPVINQEDVMKKEITKMLANIPFANRSLPLFKQCYDDYGADLRVLFHRGKFPSNTKQDAVLAKANSSKRFEVK